MTDEPIHEVWRDGFETCLDMVRVGGGVIHVSHPDVADAIAGLWKSIGNSRDDAERLAVQRDVFEGLGITDAVAEHVSRRLNPQAWEVVATLRPATREEYADALRAASRQALAAALSSTQPPAA
jgi:hypothetical protein